MLLISDWHSHNTPSGAGHAPLVAVGESIPLVTTTFSNSQLKEDENNKFRLETSKLVKSKELMGKKLIAMEMAKTALDQEVAKLKGILLNMEKEQDANRKAFDKTKNQIDNITRERDLGRKELHKVAKMNDELHEQNILHEQQIRNLENELKQCSASLQRQREVIKKLERDRDRMGDDNQQLLEKVEKCKGEWIRKLYS